MGINYGEAFVTALALAVGFYKTQVQGNFPIFKAPLFFLAINSFLVQFRNSESFYEWSKNLVRSWGRFSPEVIVLLVILSASFSTFLFGYALMLDWKLMDAVQTQSSKIVQLSCKLAQCKLAMNKRGNVGGRVLARVGKVSPEMKIPLLQDALDITVDKTDMQSIVDCLTSMPSSLVRYKTSRKNYRRSKRHSKRTSKGLSSRALPKTRPSCPLKLSSGGGTDESREAHPAELGYDDKEQESDSKPPTVVPEDKTKKNDKRNSLTSEIFTCNLHRDLSNRERGGREMMDSFFADRTASVRSPGTVLSAKLGSWMIGRRENWRVVERKQDLYDFEVDYDEKKQ